ncbi:YihY/virulence factor BrkB family protein [Bartonella sp. HY406]|uniref:YihY/virulence factor BrkB family protein n=1 Tax=Bartonella sp. HY406 TaxID=2979331 RepID=UPI0021C97607|nr:YihY/virulence factor BrkB family protein [Bartonella sp. HY406]UXN03220.1 YihY/virulence factor BrkB family protein [Bartonella sp. HY406]
MAEKDEERVGWFKYCWQILFNAIGHYFTEQGSAFASYVALSSLMAFFPFLIFATALASFLGAQAYAATSVTYILEMMPDALKQPIGKEITNVLTVQRGGLLTLSAIGAAYFASNGVEALRTALDRAYRVKDNRTIIFCRLQSLVFVIIGTIGLMAISFLLVLAPLVIAIAQREVPALAPYVGTIRFWRYFIAIIILLVTLVTAHKWLPAGKRKLVDILPGIAFTIITWLVASMLFAQYLATFANYVSTYAGLASIMVAIIFLYIIASISILGAEINAAIMFYRNRPQQPGQVIKATHMANANNAEET